MSYQVPIRSYPIYIKRTLLHLVGTRLDFFFPPTKISVSSVSLQREMHVHCAWNFQRYHVALNSLSTTKKKETTYLEIAYSIGVMT